MDSPNRKPLRLKNYDYSAAGYYFVTLCVQDRKRLFEIEKDNLGNDHIIRGEQDYLEIWQYIENNPLKYKLNKNNSL